MPTPALQGTVYTELSRHQQVFPFPGYSKIDKLSKNGASIIKTIATIRTISWADPPPDDESLLDLPIPPKNMNVRHTMTNDYSTQKHTAHSHQQNIGVVDMREFMPDDALQLITVEFLQ